VNTLIEILSPNFLLHQALVGSVLVGLVCPLVGVYFVLRRMIFLGVALPQLSAAGIACSFFVYRVLVGPYQHFELTERGLAMIGSFGFTLLGLLILAALERHKETVEARIGFTYAIAAAATILFVAADPGADAHMVSLLKGDILATTSASLGVLAAVFGTTVLILLAFVKNFSSSPSIVTWPLYSANASGFGIASSTS
jgi:ABC-type Mn2+/Zn2+ transport system permease subunit